MRSRYRLHYLFILFCFGLVHIITGQSTTIDSLNVSYPIEFSYSTDVISIQEFQTDSELLNRFSEPTVSLPKLNTTYWGTFKLSPNPSLTIRKLQLEFPISDATILFVPKLDGSYMEIHLGLVVHKQITSLKEVSTLTLHAEEINFDAPFFYKTKVLSYYGFRSFLYKSYVIAHHYYPSESHLSYSDRGIQNQYQESLFWAFYGMLMLSFIYVCVYYAFHRKRYFFFYALHLIFSSVKFLIYTPFIFNNFILGEKHYQYSIYAILNSQIASTISYLFFIKYFVDLNQSYKNFAPWYNRLLYVFVTLVFATNLTMSFNPENEDMKLIFWGLILSSFFFTLLSVTYMFIKKRLVHTSIVFAGLLIYMFGVVIFAYTRTDNIWVLPLLAVETVFFISVLSYLDLKRAKKTIEAEKLQEINQFQRNFYTNITHEFRTPLTLISGPIQEKLNRKNLSVEDREEFEMIERNHNRLLELVDQLLSVSKLESGNQKLQLQKGNIAECIERIWKDFKYQADQKDISFQMESYTGSSMEHWFDKSVIETIISNLVSNACKYTPKGGSIKCSVHILNGFVVFNIKNSGNGFTKEQYEKIFKQFYQIDENQSGAGIGLFLIRQLIHLHKGEITVDSEPNSFTIFRLNIPIHKEAFKNSSVDFVSKDHDLNKKMISNHLAEKDIEYSSTHQEKNDLPIVLIVEDHKDLRKLLHKMLSDRYQVYTASNGEIGIKLAYKYIPDLIVSDVMMPTLDGIELTKALKNDARTSHIPILLLTAKVGEEHELLGVEIGADDYIEKPFHPKILKHKVHNSIASRARIRALYQQEGLPDKIVLTNNAEQLFWNRVHEVIRTKFNDTAFNVDQFSKEMNMSRMTLHRKLKNLTGMSASEFVTSHRLKKACYYLEHSDQTIAEVAVDVGFDTISYFNKCFKEFYKCTPSEYRKTHLKVT